MAMKFKRPILIGGLGLTFGVYAWDSITSPILDSGNVFLWGTVLAGSTVWWLGHRSKSTPTSMRNSNVLKPLTQEHLEKTFGQTEAAIVQFIEEAQASNLTPDTMQATVSKLRDTLNSLRTAVKRHNLHVCVMGDTDVGKTTLIQWLQHDFLLEKTDKNSGIYKESALSSVSVSEDNHWSTTSELNPNSSTDAHDYVDLDLILFLVSGDLTESQFERINALCRQSYRVEVVFTKTDRYLPHERSQILQKLQQQVGELPTQPIHVIEAAIAPDPIKVRKHLGDGQVDERLEQPSPDIEGLTNALHHQFGTERRQLILATTMRQAHILQTEIQGHLNGLRRDRAIPVIEEYQWIAAGAAFANPVASLDLFATAAITTQMVIDLSTVYKLNFSIEQATKIARVLAEQMVKLGFVELASQALSPLLKSHILTFTAGGTLQGLSAAYLTHVAGMSIVSFFEEQSVNPANKANFSISIDALKRHLQTTFTQNQRVDFLKGLVQKGTSRLITSTSPLNA